MDNSNVVNEPLTPAQPSEGTQPQVTPEEVVPAVQPGDKTDPNLLLKSLQDEREKRRLAEERARLAEEAAEQLKSSALSEPEEVYSDEGRALKQEIGSLKSELISLKEERELEKVYAQFPDIKGLKAEFDEFRQDYPRHKLENVAKIFRAEKGLIETAPRKGLENPTGGQRTPPTSGMTAEEIEHLRQTNYRKYREMVMNDQIKLQ